MRREIRASVCSLLLAGALAAAASAGDKVPTGELVEGIACRSDPTQTYTLYLPTAYDPARRWPALFIFDPRGRSVLAAEIFKPAAEAYGWVLLSSDNTRSDGPWEPNDRALRAMWPEPFERLSVDPGRIYAGGFSGGAIAALVLAEMTRGLAGVISAGGRIPDGVQITQTYAHFGAAGVTDFNYDEMWRLDGLLASRGNPHRLEIFDGRHDWLSPDLARLAIEWLEVVAMGQGRRQRDDKLVGRLFEQDVEAAKSLEATGHPLEALWRYEAIARTFEGLADRSAVDARIAALRADGAVRKERKERESADAWGERYVAQLRGVFAQVRDPGVPFSPGRLESRVGLKDLKKRALSETYEGVVARRLLETIWTQTSFYLMRDLFAQNQYRRALSVLSVAVEIRDDSPFTWYNLACAAARSGAAERALDALERAVELGFADIDHIATDPDLESIRDEPRYRSIIGRPRSTEAD